MGIKSKDFEDFKKVVLMMKKGVHLTESGLKEIVKIREGMNMRRKNDSNDNEQ
jgi:DNA polymerase III delta prime subunit